MSKDDSDQLEHPGYRAGGPLRPDEAGYDPKGWVKVGDVDWREEWPAGEHETHRPATNTSVWSKEYGVSTTMVPGSPTGPVWCQIKPFHPQHARWIASLHVATTEVDDYCIDSCADGGRWADYAAARYLAGNESAPEAREPVVSKALVDTPANRRDVIAQVVADTGFAVAAVAPLVAEALQEREQELQAADRAMHREVVSTMIKHLDFFIDVMGNAPGFGEGRTLTGAWRAYEMIDLVRLMAKHKIDPQALLTDMEAEAAASADPRNFDDRYDDPAHE